MNLHICDRVKGQVVSIELNRDRVFCSHCHKEISMEQVHPSIIDKVRFKIERSVQRNGKKSDTSHR